MTWKDVAARLPEFVQWVVQRHGGVPGGEVVQADYERFAAEYESEAGGENPVADPPSVVR